MGDMSLFITGAAGFVGRAAVAQARQDGLRVVALVRNEEQAPLAWRGDDGIRCIACDLAAPNDALIHALSEADCTIHCAAALSGSHEADTLVATENLLAAMTDGARLVHLSSIAVYDFAALSLGATMDETAPRETAPDRRDAYAAAKIAQEAMVREISELKSLGTTILQPGAIFGVGRLWNAHLGLRRGDWLVRFGRRGQIPLAHISTVARAIIAAATRAPTAPILVLDGDLPDRIRYLRALRDGPRFILPMHSEVARLFWSRETCAARFRPLGFDNSRQRVVLGVTQEKGFEALMQEVQT